MKKPCVKLNVLKKIIRQFESKIFLRPDILEDNFWCHLRYSRHYEALSVLISDFEDWVFCVVADFQPVKKLCWRRYPKLEYIKGEWYLTARFAILRQVGKAAKSDIIYPSQPFRYGEYPMPYIGKNKKEPK